MSATRTASAWPERGSAIDELITAVAAGSRIRREMRRQYPPDRPDRFRTGEMSVHVVQRFQPVQVEDQQRHGHRGTRRRDNHRPQVDFERSQVVQAGQVVGHRQAMEPAGIARQAAATRPTATNTII